MHEDVQLQVHTLERVGIHADIQDSHSYIYVNIKTKKKGK